ncbi:ATP12 family chaperone protein [Rubellimicrobium aerolatum]|uniref:ATP12 family chaperone protein n=1 Tax=Rubellimicrobium aerolatum TaxID=490979 RepID=A0ABW0SDA2_9RHOB|nr:ATP12 family protein [Rubellimicrobium aerolatum]MBP1806786.1 chaperone required for assembly of F1-ATPase [Rubellimicrobium aerolatum]
MSGWASKRFWTEVAVVPEGDGFAVTLDGRPVRTPGKARLVVPTRAFAEEVAREWAAQEGQVDPVTMPATRLANAAIDKVSASRPEVVEMLSAFGASDLLCYRAEAPERLVARQRAGWDPLLAWSAEALGADLCAVQGVMPVAQAEADLARLREPVEAMDAFELAAFHDLVSLSGSLVLALAVVEGRLSAEEAWRLSRLDEDFQIEEWGEDEEAAEAAELRRTAFLDAARFHARLTPRRPRV